MKEIRGREDDEKNELVNSRRHVSTVFFNDYDIYQGIKSRNVKRVNDADEFPTLSEFQYALMRLFSLMFDFYKLKTVYQKLLYDLFPHNGLERYTLCYR